MAVPNDDWEARSEELWNEIDSHAEEDFRERIDALAAELGPDSAVGAFERAAAFDSTGHSDRALPLYETALEAGLEGERRRRAVIQMSSSLRNLGKPEESYALLSAEMNAGSDHLDDAVAVFLALALVDLGREREAASVALLALSRHLPRYNASSARYARDLMAPREPR